MSVLQSRYIGVCQVVWLKEQGEGMGLAHWQAFGLCQTPRIPRGKGVLPSGANTTVFVKDFVRFCKHALESIALSNLLLLAKSHSF